MIQSLHEIAFALPFKEVDFIFPKMKSKCSAVVLAVSGFIQ